MLRTDIHVGALSLVLSFFLFATWTHAAVVVSEIMYAPEGADSKHEWIEVCNTGSGIDVGDWKLYENDTNHALNLVSGSSTLQSSACAIIADDATTFSSDYPQFTGNLFDSAFSLKNTGEQLQLKDSQSTVHDDVTYSDALGGKDNGLTLHRNGASFIEGKASPGSESGLVGGGEEEQTSTDGTAGNVTSITQYQYEALSVEPPQDVHLRLPEKIETVVGANVALTAEVYDARGRALDDGRITWAFGDGSISDGRTVIHRYKHAGEYILTARIKRGSLFDEVTVPVSVAELQIGVTTSEEGEWVDVENKGMTILNLSGWRIRTSNQYFIIPEGTYVKGETKVRFDTSVTKLTALKSYGSAFLLFPDGTTALQSSSAPIVEAPLEVSTSSEAVLELAAASTTEEEIPEVSTVVTSQIIGTTVTQEVQNDLNEETADEEISSDIQTSTPENVELTAAAVLSIPRENNMFMWAVGLGTLLVLGSAGVVAARRNRALADEFTITEEHD